jgi:hypothetical protein
MAKLIEYLECKRCGYEWIPRKENGNVKACPDCRSRYWNIPKKNKDVKKAA